MPEAIAFASPKVRTRMERLKARINFTNKIISLAEQDRNLHEHDVEKSRRSLLKDVKELQGIFECLKQLAILNSEEPNVDDLNDYIKSNTYGYSY